jgi:hypothetical protein
MLADAGRADARRRAPVSGLAPEPAVQRPGARAHARGAGIDYRTRSTSAGASHDEPGEERFGCIRVAAFRRYAARMTTPAGSRR